MAAKPSQDVWKGPGDQLLGISDLELCACGDKLLATVLRLSKIHLANKCPQCDFLLDAGEEDISIRGLPNHMQAASWGCPSSWGGLPLKPR